MKKQIIILAAGKGSRMNSDLPKVMHKVGGRPMLEWVVENSCAVAKDPVLVYSEHIRQYLNLFESRCKFVLQDQQRGTAHAVWCATPLINDEIHNAVIYGDNPLITAKIIEELFKHLAVSGAAVACLAFEHEQPGAYGRIILDDKGVFKKIVEFKNASEAEKKIKLCNSGIMAFAPGILKKHLPDCLKSNGERKAGELYLTEIIEVCSAAGEQVTYYTSKNHQLVVGVNTQQELEEANKIIANKTL